MRIDWKHFSRKLLSKIEQPHSFGTFNQEMAEKHRMLLIIGKGSGLKNRVILYWLVDPSDGVIADSKFQVYGPPLLIGAAEACCDLTVGKNRHQAARINAEQIEKQLRDHPQRPAFHLDQIGELDALLMAVQQAVREATLACRDPSDLDLISPVPQSLSNNNEEIPFPHWQQIAQAEKLLIIEDVLTKEVRPYVEMDEGGVEVVELKGDELLIAYKGACTSCYSSVGATLAGIQEILRAKIHPALTVIPHLDGLNLNDLGD